MVLGFITGGRWDVWGRRERGAGQDMQDRQTDAGARQLQARETVLGLGSEGKGAVRFQGGWMLAYELEVT